MRNKQKASLMLVAVCSGVAPTVFATNGYFAHGYGIKEKGAAGSGVALPRDSLAAAANPAGMVMIGNRWDVGLSLFSPIREYMSLGAPSTGCAPTGCSFSIGPQKIESDNELFFIPSFGYNLMLTQASSVGVSVYGNGGMNTEYQGGAATFCTNPLGCAPGAFTTTPGTFGGGTAGVDLAQLFANVSYARKFAPSASWGVSGIFAYQRFEATGLSAFAGFSNDPSNLSDKGHDTAAGFGAKIGGLSEVAAGLTLAGSYQSKIRMSEFDDYRGLFADNGDFDIPSTGSIGLAFKTTPQSMVSFDIQKIWYSKIAAIANPIANLQTQCNASTRVGCLGGSSGGGFGWEDMTIYKLGYEWQTSSSWTWRVGYSKGNQPIPSSEVLFNILAPAVIEQHFTFGFTTAMAPASEFTFAAMYAPEESMRGPNAFDLGQMIELTMKQYELAASWAWKW